MNKATFIRRLDGWGGDARLYRLNPPLHEEAWNDETEDYGPVAYDHVVVSAVVALFSGPETYIFPAKSDGETISWLELDGSFRGGLDHEKALAGAGYEIAQEDEE